MPAETRMTNEEAVEILQAIRQILKMFGAMTEEITQLIIASAEHELETVDSKILLQIIQRYVEQYKVVSAGMK